MLIEAIVCSALSAQGGGEFDGDPKHPWNVLHKLFFTRTEPDGKTYREEGPDPPFLPSHKFLVEGESHKEALAFLDEFLKQNADRLVKEPTKRAVMQHDLWAVFDTTAADPKQDHQDERRDLQRRLAELMRRIALTRDEIEALPDNLLQTAKAGTFSNAFDRNKPTQPFLPDDLLDEKGPWVMVSNGLSPEQVSAPEHVEKSQGHSLFFIFFRHPAGRQATIAHFTGADKLRTPEGLHVALLRRMMLIDATGTMRPTRVTQSLQIRVYQKWPGPKPVAALEDDYNVPFEFLMNRRDLSLRAVRADEASYAPVIFERGNPFEGKYRYDPKIILQSCVRCHSSAVQSLRTMAHRRVTPWYDGFVLAPADMKSTLANHLEWKSKSDSWRTLRELWK